MTGTGPDDRLLDDHPVMKKQTMIWMSYRQRLTNGRTGTIACDFYAGTSGTLSLPGCRDQSCSGKDTDGLWLPICRSDRNAV